MKKRKRRHEKGLRYRPLFTSYKTDIDLCESYSLAFAGLRQAGSDTSSKMDLDNLKVSDLKGELKLRGFSIKGTKSNLKQRLQDALIRERLANEETNDIEVQPDDSASQTPSRTTAKSSSSVSESLMLRRADEAASRAALSIQLNALKERQQIEKQIADLKRREEQLALQAKVDEADVRETVLKRFQDDLKTNQVISSHVDNSQIPNETTHATDARDRAAVASAPAPPFPVCQFPAPLPPVHIRKFGGDVTEFAQFMRSFELKIASKLHDQQEKLYYLEQHMVQGSKPHAIISSCIYLEDGFQRAVNMLKKRYGEASTIAAAFMERISAQRSIRSGDAESLDNFALTLLSCKNALGASCNTMGDPRTMRMITEKLPAAMVDRWRRRVDEIEEDNSSRVKFEDLVDFVGREARVASNPSYGHAMYNSSSVRAQAGQYKTSPQARAPKPLIAATQAQSTPHTLECLYCKRSNHSTDGCRSLQSTSNEERWAFIRNMSLCFSCLKRGHRSSACNRRANCSFCRGNHPTATHADYLQQSQNRQKQTIPQKTPEPQPESHDPNPNVRVRTDPQQLPQQASSFRGATSCGTTGTSHSDCPALPIVPVILCSDHQEVKTFAFLDSGSTHSFVTTSLLGKIGKQNMPISQLALTTVDRGVSIPTRIASGLHISDLGREHEMQLPPLYTLEKIPVEPSNFPQQEEVKQWDHLKDVDIPEPKIDEVGLLLGANAHLAMEPQRVIPSVNGSPFAVLTRFGWVISGLRSQRPETQITVCKTAVKEEKKCIENMLDTLYNHEYEENLHSMKKGMSVEDTIWMKRVESSIQMDEGHYSVPLPFRNPCEKMPNNLSMARSRLEGLRKRLRKNQTLAEDYCTFMADMIDKGYAESIPEIEQDKHEGRIWYLPHHAVYHPTKPGKIRVVYDCASEFNGESLNGRLLPGPDQTNSLVDVLSRFRMEPVAFIADIEGMFNQVKVPKSDRDFLRFLWFENGNLDGPIRHYRMTVHLFGAASSPSVACYALKKVALDNTGEFSQECLSTIEENFYVDDVLKSTLSETEAINLSKELKDLCKRGGFNLTKFSSSCPAVVESFKQEDRSKEMKLWTGGSDRLPSERTLGIIWDTEHDTLRLSVDVEGLKSKAWSRRGLLAAVSSLWDPLGFSAPTTIIGRRILQELTKRQTSWDENLVESDKVAWSNWLSRLEGLHDLRVKRCIKPQNFRQISACEIHHFVDASEMAYGAVSYIRMMDTAGRIHCSFLKGKAHLTPLKGVTVPRLELMAAVTGVRMSALITDAIKAQLERWSEDIKEIFWTDSTTVLRYIQNTKTRFHTFVANRLAIIHDSTTPSQWRYVPSAENPADDVSRGSQSSRWLSGPEFLSKTEDYWPVLPGPLQLSQNDPEIKKATVCGTRIDDNCTRLNLPRSDDEVGEESPLEKLTAHYNDRLKLLRAVAWILKIKKFLRKISQDKETFSHRPVSASRISAIDIHEAENEILKQIQGVNFPKEIASLKAGKEVSKSSSLSKLSPFLRDGILRVGGRLKNSALEYDNKHPVVLPNKGAYIDILVQDAHQRTGHAGRQHVLAEIRRKFWILKGSSAVRRVLRICLNCRRTRAPVEGQKMANLPEERITAMEPPFTRSGADYFGPFYVRQGRAQAKRYGVLFTCLATRAVHIEVAEDLSSDSFICAIKRFIARRGCVKTLRSDRGTNFVGAQRELELELQKMEDKEEWLQKRMLENNMEWKFNTPGASHHGGVWERHIRTVRKILDSMLLTHPLKQETLHTFLCEAELIMNGRPLTPVSSDPFDVPPITPSDILWLGTGCRTIPVNIFSTSDSDHKKRWKQASYLADEFWKRYRREYLPLLQERPNNVASARKNIDIGDLVMIADDSVPRGQWPLGRVEYVKRSDDGLVRSVKVKTRGITLMRPVTKLVLLESSSKAEL